MEDKEIGKVLKHSISTAFDKWGSQYYKSQITKKGRLTKKLLEEAKKEDLFLSKRIFVLGFNRYVTKKVLENSILRKQKSLILRTILQSIIHEEGFTIKGLEEDIKSTGKYTRRHSQRLIHERYSEAFIGLDKQHKDERINSFSTVFSPHIDTGEDSLPPKLQEALNTIPMTRKNLKWMEINVRIRSITPEYLENYIKFRDEALQIMKEIGYPSKTGKVLYQELSETSEIQQIFHNHLQSIIAVGWWRSRRKTTKQKLMDDGFPWKYTDHDAQQSRDLLIELTKSEDHALRIMLDSGSALLEMNLPESAEIVFTECTKFEEGPSALIGLAHENVAIFHRNNKRSKLMIQEMKKAVECFRKSGDNYRLSVSLKNLGEAEWMYGYNDAAMRYYHESEELANSLNQEEKANALGNLAVSAQRIKNKKMEINFLIKYMTACPEDWTEQILNADKRLSDLT